MRPHGWVIAPLLSLALAALFAPSAWAADGWQPEQVIPPVGAPRDFDTGAPALGMADDGTVTAAKIHTYQTDLGYRYVLEVATHRPGGDWSETQDVAELNFDNGVTLQEAPDGSAALVWGDETTGDIYIARRAPGGVFGPAKDLTPNGAGERQGADVAIASDGRIVLAWRNRLPGAGMHDQLDAMVIPPHGAPGPVQILDTQVASDAPYSGEAIELGRVKSDSRGNVDVEWRNSYTDLQNSDNSHDSIYLATLPPGETTFPAPVELRRATGGVTLEEPFMATDAAGDLIATWRRGPDPGRGSIEGRYAAKGQLPGRLFEVPQPDGLDASRAVPALAGDGSGAIGWASGLRYTAGVDTLWSVSVGSDGTLGTPHVLGTGFGPTLTSSTTGQMIAAWSGPNVNLYYNAEYVSVRPPGGSFGPATALSGPLPTPSFPLTAIAPSGYAIAVWGASPDFSAPVRWWSSELRPPAAPAPAPPELGTPPSQQADERNSNPEHPAPSRPTADPLASVHITRGTLTYRLGRAGLVTIRLSRKVHGGYRLLWAGKHRSSAGGFTKRLWNRRHPLAAGTYRATVTWAGNGASSRTRVFFHVR